MSSVTFDSVGKRYPNGVVAVDDVSFSVADGELLVLVGPSGCGKSTLLRLLAGLETATAGRILIGDRVVNDLAPQERNVAMVFQDYALYPFLTVRRNLAFPLEMRRLDRAAIEQSVQRVAAMLDLGELLDRLPRQLSGGQRQRVAMGRALVREPSVSLLDEPLSNLDAKLRVEVRAEIAELQARTGTTMVYVTHDQTEAMTLGRRIAVLDRGKVQQVATPRELYERPANAFVAGFIGSPPMGLLPAAAAIEGDTVVLTVAGQRLRVAAPALARAAGSGVANVRSAGVRPEEWTLAADGADGFGATVEHVEFLGHETLVHARAGDQRLIVRLAEAPRLREGDAVRLAAGNAHLFDEQGRRVG
ncbi:MAG TPA: sn-glycerol-3-phosphate ABC transporter ATP-binding protein UgpC [Candidatus Dormibacteraeota bacterium]|nr:sn-glycerol-3-phosphate ABC transporter ATP-binding protein UgpC [Candidatus Dormibacteraeota bacterium]